MTLRPLIPLAAAALVAACQPPAEETPPPAEAPVDTAPAAPGPDPAPAPAPSGPDGAPGFVGAWAADASWCANTTGPERPIRLTADRFEGYENSCAITRLTEAAGGWDAELACEAEGQRTTERVGLTVRGDLLDVVYRDREAAPVTFTRCPG